MARGAPPPGNTPKGKPRKPRAASAYGVTFTEKISESVLSVTIGERLRRATPMNNVKGDRPDPVYSDAA